MLRGGVRCYGTPAVLPWGEALPRTYSRSRPCCHAFPFPSPSTPPLLLSLHPCRSFSSSAHRPSRRTWPLLLAAKPSSTPLVGVAGRAVVVGLGRGDAAAGYASMSVLRGRIQSLTLSHPGKQSRRGRGILFAFVASLLAVGTVPFVWSEWFIARAVDMLKSSDKQMQSLGVWALHILSSFEKNHKQIMAEGGKTLFEMLAAPPDLDSLQRCLQMLCDLTASCYEQGEGIKLAPGGLALLLQLTEHRDPTVAFFASHFVALLCIPEYNQQVFFGQANMSPFLKLAMENKKVAHRTAASALQNLLNNESYQSKLLSFQGTLSSLKMLALSSDKLTQRIACQTFATLSKNKQHRESMVSQGCLSPLVVVADPTWKQRIKKEKQPTARFYAVKTLKRMVKDGRWQERLIEMRVLPIFVTYMACPLDPANSPHSYQKMAAASLATLAATNDDTRRQLAEEMDVSCLTSCILQEQDLPLQRHSLQLAVTLANSDDTFQHRLGTLQLIPKLLALASSHTSEDSLRASLALARLSHNEHNAELISNHNGLPILISLLLRPERDADCNKNIAETLCNVATNESTHKQFLHTQAVPQLCEILKQTRDSTLRLLYLQTLASLSKNKEAATQMKQEGIAGVAKSIGRWSWDKQLQQSISTILRNTSNI
ncbi:hypothetical protein QOT17_023676 [Balamuthia mandrillaris]